MAGLSTIPSPHRLSLRTGEPVLVREVRPSDRHLFREGLEHLSDESLYHRFHATFDLTDAHLDYLTHTDEDDHVAYGLRVLGAPGRPGVAVARYVRLPGKPQAELALTVVDDYQGRGAGTILLAALSQHARAHGIESFKAYVHAHRRGLLERLFHFGARVTGYAAGVVELDWPIPADPKVVPDTPSGRFYRDALKTFSA